MRHHPALVKFTCRQLHRQRRLVWHPEYLRNPNDQRPAKGECVQPSLQRCRRAGIRLGYSYIEGWWLV